MLRVNIEKLYEKYISSNSWFDGSEMFSQKMNITTLWNIIVN